MNFETQQEISQKKRSGSKGIKKATSEEERLNGAEQALPVRIVVRELLMAPITINTLKACICQRFADVLEVFTERLFKFFRRQAGTDYEYAILQIGRSFPVKMSAAVAIIAIEVNEHH